MTSSEITMKPGNLLHELPFPKDVQIMSPTAAVLKKAFNPVLYHDSGAHGTVWNVLVRRFVWTGFGKDQKTHCGAPDFNVKFNGTNVNAFRLVAPKCRVPPTILETAGEYPSDDIGEGTAKTSQGDWSSFKQLDSRHVASPMYLWRIHHIAGFNGVEVTNHVKGVYTSRNTFDDQQNGRKHGAGSTSAILEVEDGDCAIFSRSVAREAAREDGVLLDIGCADEYKIYSSLRRRVLSTFVQFPSTNPSQRRRRLPHANEPTNSLPLSTAGVFTSLKYSTDAVTQEGECQDAGYQRMLGGDWWFAVFSYLANLTAEIPLDDLPILIGPCLPTLHITPIEHSSITERNVALHSECQLPRQGYSFPSKQVFAFDRPPSPVESYPKATSFLSFRVVLFPAYRHDTFGNLAFTVRDSEEDAYRIVDLFAWWRFTYVSSRLPIFVLMSSIAGHGATGRFVALMSDF
ncbi:uncharacterized protein ARMOST_20962 [Armillaria ostoyae]|uniref:Uncharacterized protein n=1 Tax=Armillaria ostoyae TaxID=47428 RepID=A0A284S8S1_ARMOS|nr:uncharacterized protein ARMOST_20962 [Armillaria ostoyae]